MFQGRYIEFFESERRLAMSNLSAFISTFTVNGLLIASIHFAPELTSDFLVASVTLGGFSFATNKLGNVWQNIRTVQAENKIQPAPIIPASPPTVTQNISMGEKKDEA